MASITVSASAARAAHDLVGQPSRPRSSSTRTKSCVALVEGGEVRTCRPQRVGDADLLVEADLAQVELEVLADGSTGHVSVERRKLHDHRSPARPGRLRGGLGTSGRATRHRCRSARDWHSRTSAPRTSLSHAGVTHRGSTGKLAIRPTLPVDEAILRKSAAKTGIRMSTGPSPTRGDGKAPTH